LVPVYAMNPFQRSTQLTTGWLRSFLWRLVIYLHLAPAAFWWWLMPGGFPLGHPRFWTNAVFPVVAIAICLAGLWAGRRANPLLLAVLSVTIPAFWLAATASACLLYPVSARRFLPPALVCWLVVSGLHWWSFRGQFVRWKRLVLAAVPAMAVAVGVVWAQRGAAPDTSPSNISLPQFEPNIDSRLMTIPVRLAEHVTVLGSTGHVVLRHTIRQETVGKPTDGANDLWDKPTIPERTYSIDIEPLLTFESRSSDRFWTIFSPRNDKTGPVRQLKSMRRNGNEILALYEDDTRSVLHVSASDDGDGATIDAFTQLDNPIYSHLNSFAAFTISGCNKPSLEFSPCRGACVDVEPFEYPVGLPLRMAYVGPDDVFHVAQAKSGEKGPFTSFGTGNLPRAAPLTITLIDDGQPVCRITLDNWSSQAGRSLSPTAGWGLPVNAIEFSQLGDDSGYGPIAIWATLAGTSVGRGWDSVGHAAGTYRNRMAIEWIVRDSTRK